MTKLLVYFKNGKEYKITNVEKIQYYNEYIYVKTNVGYGQFYLKELNGYFVEIVEESQWANTEIKK